MPVEVRFASGAQGAAALDLKAALDAAARLRDRSSHEWLQELAYGYLSEKLGDMSEQRLATYLGALQVWRKEGDCAVFKTVGDPCVAFTALAFETGIRVIALGFRYRHPASEEDWWRSVILPRLRLYL